MSKTMENVKTVNSFIRTILLLAVFSGVSVFGYWGYTNYVRPGLEAGRLKDELNQLKISFDKQQKELQEVQTANKLLKVDTRKARVKILETGVDDETKQEFMKVEFVELGRDGKAICDPRTFSLKGDKLFINGLVVKFEDKFVEKGEEFRNTSLFVFKQMYGNDDGPNEGKSLDTRNVGNETAYGDGENRGAFEEAIWAEFWEIANNPDRRDELGIRALHGQGVHLEHVVPGMSYIVQLRSSDGISIFSERENGEAN